MRQESHGYSTDRALTPNSAPFLVVCPLKPSPRPEQQSGGGETPRGTCTWGLQQQEGSATGHNLLPLVQTCLAVLCMGSPSSCCASILQLCVLFFFYGRPMMFLQTSSTETPDDSKTFTLSPLSPSKPTQYPHLMTAHGLIVGCKHTVPRAFSAICHILIWISNQQLLHQT